MLSARTIGVIPSNCVPGKHVLQALPLDLEVLVRSRHQPRQQRGLRQLAPASTAGPEHAAHAGRVRVEERMLKGAVEVLVVEHVRQAMDGHAGSLGEVERRRHLPLVVFARGSKASSVTVYTAAGSGAGAPLTPATASSIAVIAIHRVWFMVHSFIDCPIFTSA